MIGIIDYGMGNLHSVFNAFLSLGKKAKIISKPSQLEGVTHCVLPGVGAFGDAMSILNKSGMSDAIRDYVKTNKPFMGICLGLQLLFESSTESPKIKGLSLIKGNVVRFKGKVKIPHIGWNQLKIKKNSPLFKGIEDGSFVYFCHSYYVEPKEKVTIGETDYIKNYASVINKDNIFGIQFHPEKSQAIGLKILENFTKL
ncbi:MAG: imidazole glycerol phosphate synthase subunit HisH [Candidatus Omnitrophica bacterium]|nr:imidazole glycerol phosphate synthase subunit HisH [Candidatus Omnitrophota bacterium]MDD5352597.1 imidazole glycerol phosphate synthase subunit HisH [Candidatus Omnitrophota bacterium]MDD5550195.1 imidazole glycerol phosphate synthase subunit HisH [Candidatus Omnitrophota bacterium]